MRANRATGWPVDLVVLQAQARPAQAAPPRPRRRRQGADRRRPDLGAPRRPVSSGPASTPRSVRWPTRSSDGMAPAVGRRGPPGVGRPGCPTSATGSTGPWRPPTSAPTGSPLWAGLVRVLQWAADPHRDRRRRLAGRAARRRPTSAAASRPRPSGAGSRSRRCMLLGGVGLGVLLALVCRCSSSLTARQARAHGATSGCATRSPGSPRSSSCEPDPGRAGGLRRGHATGLAAALK